MDSTTRRLVQRGHDLIGGSGGGGHKPAFLKLDFELGECAQVEWGEYGTIAVGNTRRRLSLLEQVFHPISPALAVG